MVKAKKNLASAILILVGFKLDQLLSGEAEPYWAIWCAASTCFAVSAIHEQEGRNDDRQTAADRDDMAREQREQRRMREEYLEDEENTYGKQD